MKKFYAVTAGEYSDYHIITITDDKENAERIAAAYGADIEEYEDNIVNPIGVWCVSYDVYKDGRTQWVAYAEDPDMYDDESTVFKDPFVFDRGPRSWRIFVKAKDRKHAIKAAQDRYAQWKAEQEGIA